MSELSYSGANAREQAKEYVASILKALGSRDAMEVLAETPGALRLAVFGLTHEQDAIPERAGKWSVRQVVQHLVDSELVGAFHFRMILALDDFATLRQGNLRLLRKATPADLARVMRHAERGDETLSQTYPLYAGHDLVDLVQIQRIRAAIGAPAVG